MLSNKKKRKIATIALELDLLTILNNESDNYFARGTQKNQKRFGSRSEAINHYLRVGMKTEGQIK